MPFNKTGPGTYRSPSGKQMSTKQVQAYYAKQNAQGGGKPKK